MVAADDADRVSPSQQSSGPLNDELTFQQVGLQPRRRSHLLRYLVVLIVVAGLGSAAWFAFDAGWVGQKGTEIPIVHANKDPIKVKPAKPGGMKVPDQDKLIYQRLAPGAASGSPSAPVERLLPRAEAPMPVPVEPKVSQPIKKPVEQKTSPIQPQAQSQAPPSHAQPMAQAQPVERQAPPVERQAPPVERQAPPVKRLTPPPQPPQKVEKVIPRNMLPKKPAVEVVKRPPPPVAPSKIVLPVKKAAKPKVQPKTVESLLPKEVAKASTKAPFRVQLAAVRSRDIARKEWARIQKKNKDLLGPLSLSIMRADLGAKGIYFRLRAGPLATDTKARALCAKLAKRKVPCLVIRPNG